jgi:hypothetical protein
MTRMDGDGDALRTGLRVRETSPRTYAASFRVSSDTFAGTTMNYTYDADEDRMLSYGDCSA